MTKVQRRRVSRLLQAGADTADVVYAVDGRMAVLVEIDLSLGYEADAVRARFMARFELTFPSGDGAPPRPVAIAKKYVRCLLTAAEITRLADADAHGTDDARPTIFRIWPDFKVSAHIDRSVATVKADAAARSYGASGQGVCWAVVDSGIDAGHPHFSAATGSTVHDDTVATLHRDFTWLLSSAGIENDDPAAALVDDFGHGTHVAGIIAGAAPADAAKVLIAENEPTTDDLPSWRTRTLDQGRTLTGIAPLCRLVSLKVLDGDGDTTSSAVIAALDYVERTNVSGRRLRIHGVNLSIGCDWYPDEYAAGQSPLCQSVDQLVSTGVVVVVSAGNSGAGGTITGGSSDVRGQLSTITDPGNAARAITVGSTHRYAPHTYGVSYTSSKGPTLDGRRKPDLVAPGERITSAAPAGLCRGVEPLQSADPTIARYIEQSGTSMAAPHVSGAIAAFLSVRTEYAGQPDEIRRLFQANAISLDRHEFYQGAGLVDLMRVLSNV